jgi:hypothetical protein
MTSRYKKTKMKLKMNLKGLKIFFMIKIIIKKLKIQKVYKKLMIKQSFLMKLNKTLKQ